ncbi:MAG: hypothetical protein ACREOQ_16795 [Gemmatimonadales bacterium]
MKQPPDPLRALDRTLDVVRFAPRESLGPELTGRVRRGERPQGNTRPPRRWMVVAGLVAAGLTAVALGLSGLRPTRDITVDRCCFDLDGGGAADDGVRIVAHRNADVLRLWVYEDADHSGGLTPGDVVRLERGRTLALTTAGLAGLVTLERCCLDFDGGGPADDGLLVIGVPPDRVVMAAIYERGAGGPDAPVRAPLR